MDVAEFDFDLPEDRIALRPASPRDSAKLLVVHHDGVLEHRTVRDLPDYVEHGDALVVNDTSVIRARLRGVRVRQTGPAKIELLLHRRLSPSRYRALARPARKLAADDRIAFGHMTARVLGRGDGGEVEIEFDLSGDVLDAAIAAEGEMPLPPYIAGKRAVDDCDTRDYQTLFARQTGSVAAPTAGLHFTPELIAALDVRGAVRKAVTLHVGLGTFLPVTADDTVHHRMHAEHASLSSDAALALNAVHDAGKRVFSVGTTSLRTLESAADAAGRLRAYDGETDIFITPGYKFRVVDVLLTNFHLPRSTLFMLVSAMMGIEVMKHAYAQAIALGYRFYSYGDACLLLPLRKYP